MIFTFLTVATLALTLASHFGSQNMYFDLLSHLKIHLVISLLILLVWAYFKKRRHIYMYIILIIIELASIIPLYIPNSQKTLSSSEGYTHIKLMSSNVKFDSPDKTALIKLIEKENPDILYVQELNQGWVKTLEDIQKTYQYSYVVDPKNEFGIGIYSKYELTNKETINVGDFETPTLKSDIEINGKTIRLFTVHPMPPISKSLFESRNQMLASLAIEVQKSPHPVIVGGDFNITMWAQNYIQFIKKTNLKNTRNGFGILGTWPEGNANYQNFQNIKSGKKRNLDLIPTWIVNDHPIKLPIDHILVSPEIIVENMEVLEYIHSDHLPIQVRLAL